MGAERITNCRMETATTQTEEGEEIEIHNIRLWFETSGERIIPLQDTSAAEVRQLIGRLRGESIDPEDLAYILDDYFGKRQGLPF